MMMAEGETWVFASVLVFLFATGKIFHDAMPVRTALVILLASIGLAYNF